MKSLTERAETRVPEVGCASLINAILRWPEWKIHSFCLDQTDIQLLEDIHANMQSDESSDYVQTQTKLTLLLSSNK